MYLTIVQKILLLGESSGPLQTAEVSLANILHMVVGMVFQQFLQLWSNLWAQNFLGKIYYFLFFFFKSWDLNQEVNPK